MPHDSHVKCKPLKVTIAIIHQCLIYTLYELFKYNISSMPKYYTVYIYRYIFICSNICLSTNLYII